MSGNKHGIHSHREIQAQDFCLTKPATGILKDYSLSRGEISVDIRLNAN